MASLSGFDASKIEKTSDVLPLGEYRVVMTRSEMVPTKSGTGQLIKMQFQVLDGPYQNRVIFDQLNYSNPSKKAESIGQERLAKICRAVGVLQPGDTQELHRKPLRVKVKIRRSDEWGDQNEITEFSKDDGSAAPAAASPAPQASPGAASAQAWANAVNN